MRGEDWLGDIVGILGMPGRYKGEEEEAGHEAANASNQHERKILYFSFLFGGVYLERV